MRSKFGVGATLLGMLLATLALPGMAGASTGHVGFVAQARAAGLTAAQAGGLQAKIDDYLTALDGRGIQVSPNQIDMDGAVLNVTVPGEKQPRQLAAATTAEFDAAVTGCFPRRAAQEWFCAYKYEHFQGDIIAMWQCGNYRIPWVSVGSWINFQTDGTRPWMFWVDNTSPWHMPAPYAEDRDDVRWRVVRSITNC